MKPFGPPGSKPGVPPKPGVKPPAPGAKPVDGAAIKKLDDQDMDKIFKKLGVKESELSAGAVDHGAAQAPAAPPNVAPPPPLPGLAGLNPPQMQQIPGAKPAAPPVPPIPKLPGTDLPAAKPMGAPPVPPMPPGGKPMPPGMMSSSQQMPGAIPPVPGAIPTGAVPPQRPAAPAPGKPMAPPAPPMPPPIPKPGMKPPQAPAARGGGLLGNVDDAAVDKMFDRLGLKETAPQTSTQEAVPKVNVRDAVNTVRNVALETGTIAKPPRIDGISRLSAATENAQDTGSGKISSIGKFLLDQQDQIQLGKLTQQDLAESKVRVLTLEAADEIYKLLNHIATLPGVLGSCIVGHDGIPIANNLPQEYDPETVGALSLGIYVNTTNTIRKMSHNHLHQMVARTLYGFLIIADFGGGILVTVSNATHTEQLIPLMRSITQLVAQ